MPEQTTQQSRLPVGSADIILITLDTLRFDAAQWLWENGKLPNLAKFLPPSGWQKRHTPASFTYAAHHAFLAGFLPTPIEPGVHERLYASAFGGSETSGAGTFLFPEPSLPEALSQLGYQTICIGGTGFFNPENSLGRVLPSLFAESHWSDELGVADRQSEIHQVELLIQRMQLADPKPVFALMNVAAIHQPNWFYRELLPTQEQAPQTAFQPEQDDWWSHAASMVAVDKALGRLFEFCQPRRSTYFIVCSDHGTAYGEDGYHGHRLAHQTVWDVPYAEFLI